MTRPVGSDDDLIKALVDAAWKHGYDSASTDEDGGPTRKDVAKSRLAVTKARVALGYRVGELRLYIKRLQDGLLPKND